MNEEQVADLLRKYSAQMGELAKQQRPITDDEFERFWRKIRSDDSANAPQSVATRPPKRAWRWIASLGTAAALIVFVYFTSTSRSVCLQFVTSNAGVTNGPLATLVGKVAQGCLNLRNTNATVLLRLADGSHLSGKLIAVSPAGSTGELVFQVMDLTSEIKTGDKVTADEGRLRLRLSPSANQTIDKLRSHHILSADIELTLKLWDTRLVPGLQETSKDKWSYRGRFSTP